MSTYKVKDIPLVTRMDSANSYKYTGDMKVVPAPNGVYANGSTDGVYDTIKEHPVPEHLYDNDAVEMSTVKEGGEKPLGGEPGKDNDAPEKPKEPAKMVGVGEMFRFADVYDKVLMFFGTLCGLANGAAMPLMVIVFGDMTDMFVSDEYLQNIIDAIVANITARPGFINMTMQYPGWQNVTQNITEFLKQNPQMLWNLTEFLNLTEEAAILQEAWTDDMMEQMRTYATYYALLGVLVLVLGYGQICFWQIACTRQTQRIRVLLFNSILRQEISWFDTQPPGQLNTRLSDDVNKISAGIGEKLALTFQHLSTFVTGFVIGFVYGWELTLVILSVSPLLAIAAGFITKMMATMTSKELKAYAQAGAVAEEVLSSVRTVAAFGGQYKECERYNSNLRDARRFGIRKGLVNGGSMGFIFFIIFNIYALAFWYGSKLVLENERYTAGTMMIVFFSVIFGAFSIGNAAPNLGDFATARGAAHIIYDIIDLVPLIDSYSKEGIKPDDFCGNIAFKDVVFRYPSRPTVPVLQGLSFQVKVGQTVALVGPSGCGKSTTVQLLQRFYDPLSGQVSIDGHDIKHYNIKWLRQHIGVVSQEPVLFGSSIAENIRFGREGVTKEEIELASRQANAHDFISKLPKGYNTLVGERGAQLSGGQKQRIAIARALVRNPKILLLDEATSALDNESEAIVQDALDKARQGRTTIVIAHRLSTIKTADVIVGVKDGVMTEEGTHDQLMALGGLYYQLVTNQTKPITDEEGALVDEESKVSLTRLVSIKDDHQHQYERIVSTTSASTKDRHRTMSTHSEKEADENLPEAEFKRIMKMNATEWQFILLGSITATIVGCLQPAFALIFSNILGVFSLIDDAEKKELIERYCVMFSILGVIAGLSMFCMTYMFSISGETLTLRLRQDTFYTMLRQEIAFFDMPEHNTGALCTKLATDASAVQGATGSRLGTLVQSFAGIAAALAIGFVFSWQLTLIILAFAPFMMIAGIVRTKMIFGKGKGTESNEALEQGGKVATEATENMRTVATLTKEEHFYNEFCHYTGQPYEHELKMSHLHGLAYGFSQAVIFFAYAASFYAGAYFVDQGINTYEDVYKVFSAIVFGAMSVGQASSFAPDYGKAKLAAARIFNLLDRKPAIDSFSTTGVKPVNTQGEVSFNSVHFSYPTRPDVQVLRGIDITALPGQRIALVGSSGCGKSTTVQLLERFYDPHQGHVTLDGQDTKALNIQWLRSQIGIVSQEPVLFNCSIRENIAYGDNSRQVTMDEIVAVSKMANVHNFISSLPKGYETMVGDKGTQLSGGQKQRVAIARALVRNPKILLLDEATSALDTESEKIVQEALDRAQEGRTCIVIAHRLSTIQNADLIICMKNGKVLEQGRHADLMALRGFYYRLNMAQLKK